MPAAAPETTAFVAATILEFLLEELQARGVLSREQISDMLERAAQAADNVAAMRGVGDFAENTQIAEAIRAFIPGPPR